MFLHFPQKFTRSNFNKLKIISFLILRSDLLELACYTFAKQMTQSNFNLQPLAPHTAVFGTSIICGFARRRHKISIFILRHNEPRKHKSAPSPRLKQVWNKFNVFLLVLFCFSCVCLKLSLHFSPPVAFGQIKKDLGMPNTFQKST